MAWKVLPPGSYTTDTGWGGIMMVGKLALFSSRFIEHFQYALFHCVTDPGLFYGAGKLHEVFLGEN